MAMFNLGAESIYVTNKYVDKVYKVSKFEVFDNDTVIRIYPELVACLSNDGWHSLTNEELENDDVSYVTAFFILESLRGALCNENYIIIEKPFMCNELANIVYKNDAK